jgi:hypothetical protein
MRAADRNRPPWPKFVMEYDDGFIWMRYSHGKSRMFLYYGRYLFDLCTGEGLVIDFLILSEMELNSLLN